MSSTSEPVPPTGGPGEYVRSVTAAGRTLRVSIRPGTDPSVPPFLLMNGIGASLEVLHPFVDVLDPRRTVIRFDVPGVGGSPRPVVPYVLPTFTPVVAAVLARMLTPRRHRDPEYARSIAGEIYGGTMRRHPERAAHVLHSHTRVGPRRGYYYQLAATSGWTSLPFLKLIRQPTLVVAGDDDPIVPVVNARIMARLIPDARLHVYSGGHIALITEPHEFAPVVEDFLDA